MSFNKALKALAKKAKGAKTHNENLQFLTELRSEMSHLDDDEWTNFVNFINNQTKPRPADKSYKDKSGWQNFWDGVFRMDMRYPKSDMSAAEVFDTMYGTKLLRQHLGKGAKRVLKAKNIPGAVAGVAGYAAVKSMYDGNKEESSKGTSRSARNRPKSTTQTSSAPKRKVLEDDYQPARFELDESDRYFSKPSSPVLSQVDYASTDSNYVHPRSESPVKKKLTVPSRQNAPRKASLTPYQQWAAANPGLAKKVKPGQAGYEEISSFMSRSASDNLLKEINHGISNF
jgi:hypothetical protein